MNAAAVMLSSPPFAVPFSLQTTLAFTFGLASWLAVLEGLWRVTGTEAFRDLRRAWLKIFAAAAGLAIVLALVLALAGPRPAGGPVAAPQARLIFSLLRWALAGWLMTALVVGAASAWRLLKDPEEEAGCLALKMAVGMFAIVAPLLLVAGDVSAGEALSLKPLKLAAMSAVSESHAAPLQLATPDPAGPARAPAPRIAVPWLGSLAALGLGTWGAFLIWRGRLERARGFLGACLLLGPAAFLATLAGW